MLIQYCIILTNKRLLHLPHVIRKHVDNYELSQTTLCWVNCAELLLIWCLAYPCHYQLIQTYVNDGVRLHIYNTKQLTETIRLKHSICTVIYDPSSSASNEIFWKAHNSSNDIVDIAQKYICIENYQKTFLRNRIGQSHYQISTK